MSRKSFLLQAGIILFGPGVFAQDADTLIRLRELRIEDAVREPVPAALVFRPDSAEKKNYEFLPLPELLKKTTPVMIRDYGPGTLSTISLRGSGTSHTLFRWNGIALNAPNHGLFDLSLFTLMPGAEVSVETGGSSAFYGSGAIGGTINYSSPPVFDSLLVLSPGYSHGSFGYQQSRGNVVYSNGKLFIRTSAFRENAHNQYAFLNLAKAAGTIDTLMQAGRSAGGINATIAYKIKREWMAEYQGWWNYLERSIPPTMLEARSFAVQSDQNFRHLVGLTKKGDKGNFVTKFCYSKDDLGYVDSLIKLDSRTRSNTFVAVAEKDFRLKNWFLQSGATVRNDAVDNTNYANGKATLLTWSLYGSARRYLIKKTASLSLSARNDSRIETSESAFSAYAGLEKKWLGRITTRGGFGRVHRLPSMNDLFWVPGGNPGLKPETGWTMDGAIAYRQNLKEISLVLEAGAFSHQVENWILWAPAKGGIWSPENIREVHATGTELSAFAKKEKPKYGWTLRMAYNFTESVVTKTGPGDEEALGKQLIYTPYNKFNMMITGRYGMFSVFAGVAATGFAFTEITNTEFVDGYRVVDGGITMFPRKNNSGLRFSLRVNNILDQSYQVMQWRPMPGRNWMISADLPLNLNLKPRRNE